MSYDYLTEIASMLDLFFKGLTDCGVLMSYSVQLQVTTLDTPLMARIKRLIDQFIRNLQTIYIKLPDSDEHVNNGSNSNEQAVPVTKPIIPNTDLTTDQKQPQQQQTGLVVAYDPITLATITGQGFVTTSLSNQNFLTVKPKNIIENSSTEDNIYTNEQKNLANKETGVDSGTKYLAPHHVVNNLVVDKALREERKTYPLRICDIKSFLIPSNHEWKETHRQSKVVLNEKHVNSDGHNETMGRKERYTERNIDRCELNTIEGSENIADNETRGIADYGSNQDIMTKRVILVVESLDKHQPTSTMIVADNRLIKSEKSNDKVKFVCVECDCQEFHSEEELEKHFLKHACFCDMCQKMFTSLQELQDHRKHSHEGFGCFVCSVCNKRFITKSGLERHLDSHNNQYGCTFCSKSFVTKLGLTRHLDSHGGKKTAVCDVCGKSFRRADYLQTHKDIHIGKQTFSCKICPKRFVRRVQLKAHEKIHSGIKDHICDICNKAFCRNDKLKEHMMRHYNIKRFQCTVCNKYYAENRDLKIHMKSHTIVTN